MAQSPRWQLERYLPLLRLQVRQMQLDPRLQRRFDSSDLVQETLLKAHANLAAFQGQTEAELVKWLQTILANVVADEIDKARAQKRDVAMEQSLQAVLAESSARLDAYLAAPAASPSHKAERQESLLRLAAAMDELPPDLGLSLALLPGTILDGPITPYGPAVSGTGSPLLDCDADGRYNPFRTAQRKAFEEATGPLLPDLSWIAFFGLARTIKARFPFLFGKLRLPITASQLLSQVPSLSWESRGLIGGPFTIDAVTQWIVQRYRDQIGQRRLSAGVGTTFFSLLQSLLYEYPDEWLRVVEALTLSGSRLRRNRRDEARRNHRDVLRADKKRAVALGHALIRRGVSG